MNTNNVLYYEKTMLTKNELEELRKRRDYHHNDWTIVQLSEDEYLVVHTPFKFVQARVK